MSWTKPFEKDSGLSSNAIIDTRHLGAKFVEDEIVVEHVQPPELPAPETPASAPEKPTSKLVDELDRIEATWLEQLYNIKHNAGTIENKIKACVVALRQDMARLDLLAEQARKEAERGVKIARHFANSLDQIKGGR